MIWFYKINNTINALYVAQWNEVRTFIIKEYLYLNLQFLENKIKKYIAFMDPCIL